MAPQDILRKVNAVPFQPLRIYVSDGAEYDVTDRLQAHVFPTELIFGFDPDAGGIPTRTVYIAPNHVTRVEPITSATKAT